MNRCTGQNVAQFSWFLAVFGAHARRKVRGLGLDGAFVADLQPKRIEEDDRVHRGRSRYHVSIALGGI
jgi:hypothetical protein